MSDISNVSVTNGIERFKKNRAKVWLNRNNRSTLVSRLFSLGLFEDPNAYKNNDDHNLARLRTCLYADALYDGEARRRDVKGTKTRKDPALGKLQKLLKAARVEAVELDLARSAMSISAHAHPPAAMPPSGAEPVPQNVDDPRPYSPTMPEHPPSA